MTEGTTAKVRQILKCTGLTTRPNLTRLLKIALNFKT